MNDAPHEPFGMPADPTHQAVYDKVTRHLFRQGRRSSKYNRSIKDDVCLYRSKVDGECQACSVGCLIPNDRYTKNIEGASIADLTVIETLGIEGKDHPLIPLLRDLQEVHDGANNWEGDLRRLARELVVVAKKHGLYMDEVARAHAAYLARCA